MNAGLGSRIIFYTSSDIGQTNNRKGSNSIRDIGTWYRESYTDFKWTEHGFWQDYLGTQLGTKGYKRGFK